jgi:hypothetical protein
MRVPIGNRRGSTSRRAGTIQIPRGPRPAPAPSPDPDPGPDPESETGDRNVPSGPPPIVHVPADESDAEILRAFMSAFAAMDQIRLRVVSLGGRVTLYGMSPLPRAGDDTGIRNAYGSLCGSLSQLRAASRAIGRVAMIGRPPHAIDAAVEPRLRRGFQFLQKAVISLWRVLEE